MDVILESFGRTVKRALVPEFGERAMLHPPLQPAIKASPGAQHNAGEAVAAITRGARRWVMP